MGELLEAAKLEPPITNSGTKKKTTKQEEEEEKQKQTDAATPTNKSSLKIAVGSSNPCKIEAVEQALQRALQNNSNNRSTTEEEDFIVLEVEGFSVESGVADQPFGDEETREGAKNRAESAYAMYKTKHGEYPHLAIGLEGGLEWSSTMKDENEEDTLWCMAWMAIYGKRRKLLVELLASEESKFYTEKQKPIFGVAKTATFLLPSQFAKLVEDGMELGDADDHLFGRVNGKHGDGTVGILTNGLIPRSEYYEHALLLALVPWIRPDVYGSVEEPAAAGGLFSGLICSSRNNK
jgi:non-canonical (house-cleaning) NTP pyrophosphatase